MSKQHARGHPPAISPGDLAAAVVRFQEATDLVDSAAARALSVNRTDVAMLGILTARGPLSAGELAEAVGLSPAATTASLDRLTRAGYVARARDDRDGRRRTVMLTDHAVARIEEVYGPVGRDGLSALATYSASELAVIHDFLARGSELQRRHARRISEIVDVPVPPDLARHRRHGGQHVLIPHPRNEEDE